MRQARRPGSRSPTASRSGRDILRSLILSLALTAAACGSSGTPEDELRALVDSAEAAAEERDVSGLRDLVADDYEDASGRDAADVRNLLHAWLVAHPSVNLMTRIDSIELEGTELARVKVTVPKKLTKAEREALEGYQKVSREEPRERFVEAS